MYWLPQRILTEAMLWPGFGRAERLRFTIAKTFALRPPNR
jgi:hypothetical protein